MTLGRVPVLAVVLGFVLAGCGGAHSSSVAAPDFPSPTHHSPGSTGPSTPSSPTTNAVSSGATKLLVFVIENHSLSEMQSQMPWTYQLGTTYGYATDFHAMTHPSLPNYLAIAGGSTFGVQDDLNPPDHPISGASVFGERARPRPHRPRVRRRHARRPAPSRTRASTPCGTTRGPTSRRERGECRTFDTPLDRFPHDVRAGRSARRRDGGARRLPRRAQLSAGDRRRVACAKGSGSRCRGRTSAPGGSPSSSPPTRTTARKDNMMLTSWCTRASATSSRSSPLSHLSLSPALQPGARPAAPAARRHRAVDGQGLPAAAREAIDRDSVGARPPGYHVDRAVP